MIRKLNRKSKYYDGTQITTHQVTDLLPNVLTEIHHVYKDRPDIILACWPEVVGQKIAPMTRAMSFQEGILTVKVKNSSLYSLLSQQEKPRILFYLREKFPSVVIKNIKFLIG